MALRVALHHLTEYRFDRLVGIAPHQLRLRPAPHCRTPIRAYSLRVEPPRHFINWQQDPFGNFLARLVFPEPARSLRIEVDLVAEMTVINPFDFFLEPYAENFPFEYEPMLARHLAPYLERVETGLLLSAWVADIPRRREPTVDFLVALNQKLQQAVEYVVRLEPGVQSCEETLGRARGSCRDSAWLLAQILRQLGLAARFVSGYLVQLAPDAVPLDGPAGPGRDFTDLHAWTEVYVPGAGWIGLDPTSGLFAGEGHIPLACAPSPEAAAAVTGATDRCAVEFSYANQVTRIHEDPRVTRPYTETQWADILALGLAVDAELAASDVRLTQGGEPTFVAIDDMDGAEWNTAALGPTKRRLAEGLLGRLRDRFAPGALLHHGQGKWYPGEPLPRWALGCYWRTDGVPVWREPALLADPERSLGHEHEAARRYAESLALRLGLRPEHVTPAFEDALYYLWREDTLPVNLDLTDAALADAGRRQALARLLEQDARHVAGVLHRGLVAPVGYALPLAWCDYPGTRGGRWMSSRWQFRRDRMQLLPGDSPMGLRLPLDSLPWLAPEERELPVERSLFEPIGALGDTHGEVARRYSLWLEQQAVPGGVRNQGWADVDHDAESPTRLVQTVRTALCVEARAGCVHVFVPPLSHLEHYLDLVASIEATAADLGLPVVIEGYAPPRDPRLRHFTVTPDPGVIEVNIHPAATWQELVDTTLGLYEAARESRLGTEKFMLDGRHSGTGGGNHITLGAATPAQSPWLRRPDLLRSFVLYWQQHPSLSYLFSGLFIGPTSQAPRVDEGRDERLYELEIAFQQLPQGGSPPPWLVDRLLRNLLVDLTGNTHRAEFCIDKLYSPDSEQGRLGLVELRAFEMPPHARMSLVQSLLVRALLAWFWRAPRTGQPVRWGTALHDRYLLPHYLWGDLMEVVADLGRAGFACDGEWFRPFLEFRLPPCGTVQIGDVELELRQAIEPWHVLGEEASALGTARYVDSSVERLQARLSGATDPRHVLTCNGRRVPLRATGRQGERVAGVRFRAWQPHSALHPTIAPHVPLVFDIIDTWTGRSIGGCTYHVAHAGGRNYVTLPVNANEAEARRVGRYWAHGHTPGAIQPPPERVRLSGFYPEGLPPGPREPPAEEPAGEYPHTLDLRWRPRA